MFIFIILAIVILAVLITLNVIIKKSFGRGKDYDVRISLRNNPDLIKIIDESRKSVNNLNYEEVNIISHDKIPLYGRFYNRNSDITVICFHGYHSNLINDFCTAIEYLLSLGFNVLTVSQRCHGKSGGKYLTFGVKERFDCLDWCNYVIERLGKDTKIILDGVSMGATTVTMAADKSIGLPENVKLVIADSGFSSPYDIISDVVKKQYHIAPKPVLTLMRPIIKLFCDFDIKGASSVDAVKNTKIPIFFAHGKADDFVPYRMGVEISNACVSDHLLFSAENAGHGLSFVVDPENYKKELMKVINKYVIKN